MLRLVYGLGTRAVDRVEDDYPQIIALDEPLMRPYADAEATVRFSQHNVDLLDIDTNCLTTVGTLELFNAGLNLKLDLLASVDRATEQRMKELGDGARKAWVLTFEKLLSQTDFAQVMRGMLKTLEKNYAYPVDIEFTVNFTQQGTFRINLVQCRPLQTKGQQAAVRMPEGVGQERIIFSSRGNTMGGSISQAIRRIIYVDPARYVAMPLGDKNSIARVVGKLNRQITDREALPTILLGPGRWGTTTPNLGVPVSFAEINKIAVLVEIAYEGSNLMPELSFGTHFFQDLVESDIFYVALFPQKAEVIFNKEKLYALPDLLSQLLPEDAKYADAVKVCEVEPDQVRIVSDVISQQIICYFT